MSSDDTRGGSEAMTRPKAPVEGGLRDGGPVGRRRLLVVDDDPNVIALVEAAFSGRPVQVVRARSADEALQRLAGGRLDLVLLDVVLPDRSGLEVLRLMMDRGLDVPVIVITSHASMDVAVEAMKRGAYDFLAKPLRVVELEKLVDGALARSDGSGPPLDGAGPPLASPVEPGTAEERLVGRSPGMIDVYKTIGRVAQTNATVLISGESGTGKELVARVIHRNSGRARGPFLAINCAAIPEGLLESELFGHERGAFTGAVQRARGKVERADGGTLFLDEVGDMSLALQSKVLRVLERREVERVGGAEPHAVDVRIIAATNRDLEQAVADGAFREDLYYRLAVIDIRIPPLRERPGDVPRLTDHFVRLLRGPVGRSVSRVESGAYERLEAYDWPGNVRELRNVIERSLILGRGGTLRGEDLPALDGRPERGAERPTLADLARRELTLEALEKQYLGRVLRMAGWNQSRAARILGIHRNTLRRKMGRYGLAPPD